jgi:SH3-like domain-containing protein
MKRQHTLRNIVLLASGAAGVAMLIPSDDGASANAPQLQSSILSTSPELSNYLEARLQSVAIRPTPRTELDTVKANSPVHSLAATVPVTVAPPLNEFESRSSTALHVRAGPSTETPSLFVFHPDIPVRVDQIRGNWARISTSEGSSGWAYAPYLTGIEPQQLAGNTTALEAANSPPSAGSANATISAASASVEQRRAAADGERQVAVRESTAPNATAAKSKAFLLTNDTVMRSSPSSGSRKLSVVPGGSKLLVAEWDGRWARVILTDGTSGWITVR